MATLPSYLKTPREKSLERKGKILGFVISWPLIALFLMWYNYVIIQWGIAYWQWLAISLGLIVVTSSMKWLRHVIGLVFAVAIIGQIASWIGLLSLPLIK